MDYYVSINGHTIAQRPSELPEIVKEDFVYRAEQPESLTAYIEERLITMKRLGGLACFLEQQVVVNEKPKMIKKPIFVPLHMITYVDTTIRALAVEIPSLNDEGVLKQ